MLPDKNKLALMFIMLFTVALTLTIGSVQYLMHLSILR
jgi:hypothetical protein